MIKNPKEHLKNVQIELISKTLAPFLLTWWKAFKEKVAAAFKQAAESAKLNPNPTKSFVEQLHDYIKIHISVRLSVQLPTYTESISVCNRENVGRFDRLWSDVLALNPVPLSAIACPLSSEVVAFEVLKSLESSPATTENSSLKPRCCEPCPICKCPCDQAANHETKHRTCHQPGGLVGLHWIGTDRLVQYSCFESVTRKDRFKLDSMNEYRSYEEYHLQFQDWEQPVRSLPLKLREYILTTFNEQIAEFYHLKPAIDIPASSYHNLKVLETVLQNFVK
jgi:hypothetical protein